MKRHKLRTGAGMIIGAAISWALPAFADEPVIGYVKTVSGTAYLTSGGAREEAAPGDALHRADVLETAGDGTIGATFKDDSQISLGPASKVELTDFRFAPATQEYGFTAKVVSGTAFVASGLIAKLSPGAAKVETPSGTIGVRGTRFAVRVTP